MQRQLRSRNSKVAEVCLHNSLSSWNFSPVKDIFPLTHNYHSTLHGCVHIFIPIQMKVMMNWWQQEKYKAISFINIWKQKTYFLPPSSLSSSGIVETPDTIYDHNFTAAWKSCATRNQFSSQICNYLRYLYICVWWWWWWWGGWVCVCERGGLEENRKMQCTRWAWTNKGIGFILSWRHVTQKLVNSQKARVLSINLQNNSIADVSIRGFHANRIYH